MPHTDLSSNTARHPPLVVRLFIQGRQDRPLGCLHFIPNDLKAKQIAIKP